MVGRERRGGLVSVVNETSVSCAHRQADCGERGEQSTTNFINSTVLPSSPANLCSAPKGVWVNRAGP